MLSRHFAGHVNCLLLRRRYLLKASDKLVTIVSFLSHLAEVPRSSIRLPDRSPGIPNNPGKKADQMQAESGDRDDCHS